MEFAARRVGASPADFAMPDPPGLIFGIFPGMTGTEIAAPAMAAETYDPARTDDALARLQAPGRPFVIRGYVVYKGSGRIEKRTPPDMERYLHSGRVLDYVVCYRPEVGGIDDWTAFVRQV